MLSTLHRVKFDKTHSLCNLCISVLLYCVSGKCYVTLLIKLVVHVRWFFITETFSFPVPRKTKTSLT